MLLKRVVSALVASLVFLGATGRAGYAQEMKMSLVPKETTVQRKVPSLLSNPVVVGGGGSQVEDEAPAAPSAAQPLSILPDVTALEKAAKEAKIAAKTSQNGYKLVKVPLPPVVKRLPEEFSKQAERSPGADERKAPTGIFALLSQPAPPSEAAVDTPSSAETDIGRVSPVVASLSTPRVRRGLPGVKGAEDDEYLDESDNEKIAEKQVDSVEISCLKPQLMSLIHKTGQHFGGKPVITSGYRNRGRRGSYHRKCEAADFFIEGVSSRELVTYLRNMPGAGGVGTYCHTKSVHLDIGEARNWHQCGFRRSFALRTPVVAEIGSR